MVRVQMIKRVMVVAMIALAIVVAFYALRPPEDEANPIAAGAAAAGTPASLRDELLRTTWQEVGVRPIQGVWGVLMERGYGKGVATVVALADGTASLYVEAGPAVMGGHAYNPARTAAVSLCQAAAQNLGETIPAHEFPRPAKGRVRFYVLTDLGVRTAEGNAEPLRADGGTSQGHLAQTPRADGGAAKQASRDSLMPLMAAGQSVLDALKEATARGILR